MAVQLAALRDALMNPGDEVKANKAAEDVGGYESQFTTIKIDLAALRGEMVVLKLRVGSTIGQVLLVLGSNLTLWSKIGDLSGQIGGLSRVAH